MARGMYKQRMTAWQLALHCICKKCCNTMETTLTPAILDIKVVNMFLLPVSQSVLLLPVSQLLHLPFSQFLTSSACQVSSSATCQSVASATCQFLTSSAYPVSSSATCQPVASATCQSVILLLVKSISSACQVGSSACQVGSSACQVWVLLIVKSVFPLPVSQYIAVCVC